MSKLLINKIIEVEQTLDDDNNVVDKKTVSLHGKVVDENTGNIIMNMRTTLLGDGETPSTVVYGSNDTIQGYRDDGSVILTQATEKQRKENMQKFRARAIKEQKALTEENGVDPSVVNIYGAENDNNKKE